MWKTSSLALALVCFLPGLARALELKNIRFTYGPLGALRSDDKFLPGDGVFIAFDIDGLKVDKVGKASYEIRYDVLDSQNKADPSGKPLPQDNFLALGGTSVPGILVLEISPKQPPGKYRVKLTVLDRKSKDKVEKVIPFEITPMTFGFVGVSIPAVGLPVPGDAYRAQFGLTNMALDKKKLPTLDVTMRVLDEKDKELAPPLVTKYPRDLTGETDFQKTNFIAMAFPIFLNRPGRFILAIDAHDKNADKKVQLRVPLTVLDLSKIK